MVEEKKTEMSFDEYWAEEEKVMKLSHGVSKQWKELRYNKAPAKELVDLCEGRLKDGKKE